MCYTSHMIIAIDTGGTKTLIESFDEHGTKTYIDKFPTPRDKNEWVSKVVATIRDYTKDEPIEAVSIAIPGPIADHILVESPNIGWTNFDITGELRQHFPNSLVLLANDADLGGIGAAHQLDDAGLCLYVTLSTGIGTGLSYQRKLLPEIPFFEGGKMRIEYGDELVRWEHIASGKNFYERYGQFGSDVDDPEKWRDYAERVAKGLLILIPTLEPQAVIIGGSMGTHFAKYADFLQEILDEAIAKHMKNTQIVQAHDPEEIVIYGCYHHALDQLARR